MIINSIIDSTGYYIPSQVVSNADFLNHQFLDKSGNPLKKENKDIIEKMESITMIEERRYEQSSTRLMASEAAEICLQKSPIKRESLGGIIVAHNFGDIQSGESHGHMIPNLAAKVKHDLQIKNSKCFAFDVLFGCPGWVLAMDQAHQYIQNGIVDSVLVVGVELLSRVIDPNDIDGMLFGDGAGATLLVAKESETKSGILGYQSHSDCGEELEYLRMNHPVNGGDDKLYLDMTGRSVFKYAVGTLPTIITECLNDLNLKLEDIDHFLFHQANGKMLHAIADGLSALHGGLNIMRKTPIIIQKTGNSSVATVPTLLDLLVENQLDNHRIRPGDKIVMASVGAGMHANCLVYQC
ncbi:MAG: ketoacyl-ACP synthase III [Cyclobacteriaceae bacterium]